MRSFAFLSAVLYWALVSAFVTVCFRDGDIYAAVFALTLATLYFGALLAVYRAGRSARHRSLQAGGR